MRTAVIGAGRMGRRHVQVVTGMNLDLVAVADPMPAARASAITECALRDDQVCDDAAAMLRDRSPEVVVVSTTAPTHADYTVMAAEQGAKYILCEKPMATSLADCDRMLEACRANGARLAINHQMRFMEQYTIPQAIVSEPSFGGLTGITVVAGNFGLAMNGSHYFEMLRVMAGEPAARVSAWLSSEPVANPRGAQFEDRAGQIRAETAGGTRFYMDIGDDQGQGMHVIYAGRYGQLVVNELAGNYYLMEREAEHRPLPTTRYGMPWTERTARIAPADVLGPTRDVLRALLDDAGYPNGEDGRVAVASLVAAYLSDEQGHAAVDVASAEVYRTRSFPWA